jgi:hypothetical protein
MRCGADYFAYAKSRKFCSWDCYEASAVELVRRRAKRDANHRGIQTEFERLGWSVLDAADFGRGMPDLLIGDESHGIHFVEVKNLNTAYGRRGLSKSQQKFKDMFANVVHVVTSVEGARELTLLLTHGSGRADGKPPKRYVVTSPADVANL